MLTDSVHIRYTIESCSPGSGLAGFHPTYESRCVSPRPGRSIPWCANARARARAPAPVVNDVRVAISKSVSRERLVGLFTFLFFLSGAGGGNQASPARYSSSPITFPRVVRARTTTRCSVARRRDYVKAQHFPNSASFDVAN